MTEVEWHKLQGDLPEKTGHYLVTIDGFPPKVRILGFLKSSRSFDWYSGCDDELKAWAELPEPYAEPEPIDYHPDAIAARRYMKNYMENNK